MALTFVTMRPLFFWDAVQRMLVVLLRQFQCSLSVPNLTGPSRTSRNFDKQQQNLRCAKILEEWNAPCWILTSRINNGFLRGFFLFEIISCQIFTDKCSCTHKLLSINCFEKVVSHNVKFSRVVTKTIKHECTNCILLLMEKGKILMLVMTMTMVIKMIICVEYYSLNLICY